MIKWRPSFSLSFLILIFLGALVPQEARCELQPGEFHLRAGLVSGRFSGLGDSSNGSFSIPNSLDLEYELITGRHFAFFVRSTLAYQISTGVMPYAYGGIGARYYLGSNARGFESGQNGVFIRKKPVFRFYLGPELGVSQAVIKQYTAVIQTASQLVEIGAHLGLIYQISSAVGLEAQAGYSFGFSISTVSTGASILKGLVGVSFYY